MCFNHATGGSDPLPDPDPRSQNRKLWVSGSGGSFGVRLHPLRRWPEARLLGGGSAAAAAASSCAQNCARAQSAPGLALATATRCKPRRREAAATAPCENANPATGSLIVTPPNNAQAPPLNKLA
jgi:hypothetical protein